MKNWWSDTGSSFATRALDYCIGKIQEMPNKSTAQKEANFTIFDPMEPPVTEWEQKLQMSPLKSFNNAFCVLSSTSTTCFHLHINHIGLIFSLYKTSVWITCFQPQYTDFILFYLQHHNKMFQHYVQNTTNVTRSETQNPYWQHKLTIFGSSVVTKVLGKISHTHTPKISFL